MESESGIITHVRIRRADLCSSSLYTRTGVFFFNFAEKYQSTAPSTVSMRSFSFSNHLVLHPSNNTALVFHDDNSDGRTYFYPILALFQTLLLRSSVYKIEDGEDAGVQGV